MIAVCAVGALVGWPFVALAMLPLCLYTLAMRGAGALGLAVAAAAVALAPQLWVGNPHLGPSDLHPLHAHQLPYLTNSGTCRLAVGGRWTAPCTDRRG